MRLFWNIGEFIVKTYFTDYLTANAILLIVAIKGDFVGLFFNNQGAANGNYPETG